MSTLKQAATGSTVKISYRGDEYKGIVLKHKGLGPRYLLLADRLLAQSVNCSVGNSTNILSLSSEEIPMQQARLPKEVGDMLRTQYNALVDVYELQYQTQLLEKKRQLQMKALTTTNELVTRMVGSKIIDTKKPVDTIALSSKIQRDLAHLFREEKTRRLGNYTSGEASIALKAVSKGKNNSVLVRYILQLSVEERIMSKEYEDRIRGDEEVNQRQVKQYTPTIEAHDVERIFGSAAKIIETKNDYQEQDKGWVSFYRKALVEAPLDLTHYEKSIELLAANLDKTYPERK